MYCKRLNEFIEAAKDYYFFNSEGQLFSLKNNKLNEIKTINNGGSIRFSATDNKIKSVSVKNLKKYYELSNKKQYWFDKNTQLELDIKSKEINTDDLKQLSSFESKYKECYYFDKEGRLYNAKRGYKELALHQKNKQYQPYMTDNKIAPISPNYLRALYGNGFENTIEQLENEEWKWVEGYEGIYKVSNMGRIVNSKGLREQFLVGKENDKYYYCLLSKEGQKKQYRTHRLVAKAFCEGYKEGLVVNHKDLNKTNNHYTNLEWITLKENSIHYHQNKHKLIS